MSIRTIYKSAILFMLLCSYSSLLVYPQGDSAKGERQSLIYLRYYVINNQVPYLNVQTKNKIGKAFLPQDKVAVSIYLDKDSDAESQVGKVVTNEKGVATVSIPANLAAKWGEEPTHTFFAHADSSNNFDATSEELLVSKSKLELDTSNDGEIRSLKARLFKNENDSLVPMAGVDIRLAVKRLGGYLDIGEEESYTTDSTGNVEGEFNRKDLPGDTLGNLEVVAIVDDNDEVGSLETRLKVPWGVAPNYSSNFGKRSLYATGDRAPVWLMIMAYGSIAAAWAVIIYLLTRIIQIRRLGLQKTE
jgi:hypothetical protein